MGGVEVLGHRGSRVPGPENSVRAVQEALAAGAAGVELDVRRSRDGHLVCVHDPVLENGSGVRTVIAETDAADLRARGVPSVAEMLDAGQPGRLVLEVKNQRRQPDYDGRRGTSARLLAALLESRLTNGESAAAVDDVLVSSFDGTAIAVARRAGLRTALLTLPTVPIVAGLRLITRGGHAELHAHTSALPARMPRRVAAAVARVHEHDVRLVIWTVTATDEALRFRDAGVDAVICDDPAAVVQALRG
jgi:glycerophosphoryl diester phosphodiesterase